MTKLWQQRSKPARLERRYEFEDYETLRSFLDQAANLSEKQGLYPDMGFGSDYVNITIHADVDDDITAREQFFADQLDALLANKSTH